MSTLEYSYSATDEAAEIASFTRLPAAVVETALERLEVGEVRVLVVHGGSPALAETVITALTGRPGSHRRLSEPIRGEVAQMLTNARRARCHRERTEWMLEHYHGVSGLNREQLAAELCRVAADSGTDPHGDSVGVRRLLEFYGTRVRRAEDPDHWLRLSLAQTLRELASDEPASLYFTDPRFPSEIDWFSRIGADTVHVTGAAPTGGLPTTATDIARKALDHAEYDVVVDARGLDPQELAETVIARLR